MRKTSKITMLNGVTKLHPIAAVRVSQIGRPREDVYSFETQSEIVSSCAYDNYTIPVEGLTLYPVPCTIINYTLIPYTLIPCTLYPTSFASTLTLTLTLLEGLLCLTEIGCAWDRVPTYITQILNGGDMYTFFNVLIVSWVSRFLRCVETLNELEPLFKTKVTLTLILTPNPISNRDLKKDIQIWSAMDGIGSLTDPVEFLRLVTIAEAESKNNHERQRQVVMITLTLNLTPTLTLTLTLA